jgi:superfamily I DNA/RNA helicase/mRNA-degrading endonuclease RelE of RelBE toxin-antitoxin system
MPFMTSFKGSFLPDFIKLDRNLQKQVMSAVDEVEENPNTPRGNTIKKLTNHDRLWRYRVGDHRMIYAVYPERKVVQLLAVGHRDKIYDRFHYHPDRPEHTDYSKLLEQALHPDEPTPPEWLKYLKPEEEEDTSPTLTHQLTPERLVEWGIPEKHHHHFTQCETENELLECGAPDVYIMRVIELVDEPSIEHIAQDPNYVLEKSKDLEKYASGDLISFLLLLDRKQEQFVDWALEGPTLVKGGPGSGKSTVALYRAKELVERAEEEGNASPSILFTTYTNALVKASEQMLDRLLAEHQADVEVSTVDRIAMQIYRAHNRHPRMVKPYHWQDALISARAVYSPQSENQLERMMLTNAVQGIRADYLLEEFKWIIEGRNIDTLEKYLDMDRSGRGYAFNPSMRKAVWNIYQHTKRYLREKGLLSWGDLRSRALALVQSRQWKKRWDYVIIDEAQDLTPTALSLCVEIAQDPKGIFLTADASQSLYNRGFAWKNVHDSLKIVGRTRILRRNYRTTRQIVDAANSLMIGTGAGDKEALEQEYVHVGPKPVLYRSQTRAGQLQWLVDQLKKASRELRMPLGSAAVLSPTNDIAEEVAAQLNQIGLPVRYMRGKDLELDTPHIKSMTIHSAKGLEFPIVAYPLFEEGIVPFPLEDERAEDLDKHLAQERRKTFVAWTRAMRRLFVTTQIDNESPFFTDLDLDLWTIVTE